MPRSLKFFYFGHQCPHNAYLLARIKTIAWKESVPLHLFDITNDEETCARYRIFSPNMLIVNDKYRLHGPFSKERIVAMLDDEDIEPRAYAVKQSEDVVKGDLLPLTPKSVLSTCVPCIGPDDTGLCRGKAEWIGDMMKSSGLDNLGYLHFVGGMCVGGAEFLPSEKVPYPIPDKRDDNAFITCSFLSDEAKDYRTHPLLALLGHLRDHGFSTVSVAASVDVVFPNGPVEWFERKGFKDRGVLINEELHCAEIHYLQLRL